MDKLLIVVSLNSLNATQQQTILTTATFPCTIVGLRWNISVFATAGTAACDFFWAIVKVPDGNTASAMAISDGAVLYAPEQSVMTWGCADVAPGDNPDTVTFTGDTKTMRKMMGGDKLIFICKGEATNETGVRGIVQFFCKT